MLWLCLRVVGEDPGTVEQCRGPCCLRPLQAPGVKHTRVCVVIDVDPVIFKVHFDPVVCCSPGKQTVMIIVGGYRSELPCRFVCAHWLPTEFAQIVYDLDNLKRSTLHLGKARLSNVDPHRGFAL